LLAIVTASCQTYQWRGTPYQEPQTAPEIEGINWDDSPFRLSEQAGKVALLFFGYTYCPDICPTTLAEFKQIKSALGDQAEDVEFVFVSLDPERDSPQRLSEYVPAFDEDFYGVFVEGDRLPGILSAYGAIAQKRPAESGDPNAYTVDHTARTYLVDPAGRLFLSYSFGTPTGDVASDVRQLLRTSSPAS
jgi:protein SCO1/2